MLRMRLIVIDQLAGEHSKHLLFEDSHVGKPLETELRRSEQRGISFVEAADRLETLRLLRRVARGTCTELRYAEMPVA